MIKKLLLGLSLIINVAPSLFAQHDIAPATLENIEKIFAHAQKGYNDLDARQLYKAANLLIQNPQIQRFSKNELNADTIPTEAEKDFFDPQKIIEDALEIAAIDARLLRFQLQRLEEKMANYQKMELEIKEAGGDIQVKNYLISSKKSRTITTNFEANKKITLSVRVGNDLRLGVTEAQSKKKVGTSQFIGDARMLTFTASADGAYQITIENVSNQSNDCLLMIETK